MFQKEEPDELENVQNEDKNVSGQFTMLTGAGQSEAFEDIKRKDAYSEKGLVEKNYKALIEAKVRLEAENEGIKAEIEQKKEEIHVLRESQDLKDIPVRLVENKVGPVKVQNLSKIGDFDRRWFQSLARRFGELVIRRLVELGNASIKFYIISKDRTTNTEYLIPINFTMDLMNKSTELELDENRL
jgi:hypothetical protein